MGSKANCGVGDDSYQAAGWIEGLRRLIDDFYWIMDEPAAAEDIRRMYRECLDSLATSWLAFSVVVWVDLGCTAKSTVLFRLHHSIRSGRLMKIIVLLGWDI